MRVSYAWCVGSFALVVALTGACLIGAALSGTSNDPYLIAGSVVMGPFCVALGAYLFAVTVDGTEWFRMIKQFAKGMRVRITNAEHLAKGEAGTVASERGVDGGAWVRMDRANVLSQMMTMFGKDRDELLLYPEECELA